MENNNNRKVFNMMLNETADKEMFRKNKEFYEENPIDSLKLTPTEWKTEHGRRVYLDQHGSYHSEITETKGVNVDGKEVYFNFPRIFGGNIIPVDSAIKIIVANKGVDPETGEKLIGYNTINEAVEGAKDRMRGLNNPELPWMK
tara:strand:+ start:709 stop:1140 length:432 start_codon:yes stop_codon:yes gene_type:complete